MCKDNKIIQGYPIPLNGYYMVNVSTASYNHAPYIEGCLKGVAIQQTKFPFVQLVVDDCSTDGEQSVIKDWMERECDMEHAEFYDNDLCTITVVKHKKNTNYTLAAYLLKKNMYGNPKKKELFTPWRVVCPYIALCEGDDYWTDPLKLQKQVDFLEEHEEYDMVCCRYVKFWQKYGKFEENDNFAFLFPNSEKDVDFTLEAFPWIPQVLTIVYRTSLINKLEETFYHNIKYKYDVPFLYATMRYSKIRILNEVMGVYRKHELGAYSGLSGADGAKKAVDTYSDIYRNDPTEIIKELLTISLWNYGYLYVKYQKNFAFSEVLLTYRQYSSFVNSKIKKMKYLIRILRGICIRVIKRPYQHPQLILPKFQILN